jgi:hypothetical protein
MSDWRTLLRVVEADLALAEEGRWDELAASLAARPALLRAVPDATPADRPVVELVARAHQRVVAELALAREQTGRELVAVHRGRGAMNGYRSAAGGRRERAAWAA